jgi:hypothetical protein
MEESAICAGYFRLVIQYLPLYNNYVAGRGQPPRPAPLQLYAYSEHNRFFEDDP